MRKIWGVLAPLALMALPVGAADMPPGCAWLCGNWTLDTARSEAAEYMVDVALEKYREPDPPKPGKPRKDDPPAQPGIEVGPAPLDRPMKAEMRSQLLALLTPPASLVLGEQGNEVLIRAAGAGERRVFPGEPHSRVNAGGTTKVSTEWKKDALIINEDQGRGREQTETYALLPDGTLQVTRVVERPGVKLLRLRAVYRRG
jgi:hypothetical protein